MTFRAFVSVDVGAAPGLVELHEELAAMDAQIKPVDPQNYHVTMKFLGDIGRSQAEDVLDVMRLAAQDVEPFTCRLEGVGAFPDDDFIKVVWAGIEGGEPLTEIAATLEDELGHIRQAEHEFTPHVTLARMKGGQGKGRVQAFLDDHRHDDLGTLKVDDIRLKESTLQGDGPVYATVDEAPLG